jgi:hypothetical protein
LRPSGCRQGPSASRLVAKLAEQRFELVGAAVDVADDVERAVVAPAVVPERLPRDRGCVDGLFRRQHVDVPEPFAAEAAQRSMQLAALLADHVRAEAAIGAAAVALVTDPLGQIEHEGDRQDVVLAGQRDQRLASLRLHVGGVDDGQAPARQAPRGDEVKGGEGVSRRGLVVLVVRDEPAEAVRREHFGGGEVTAGERRLAAPGGADEDDQREFGDGQRHRVNTAICVGAPTVASSSPIPSKRTA